MDKKYRKWDPMFDRYFESAVFKHGHNVNVLQEILKYRYEDLELISRLGIPIEELKELISEMERKKLFFNFKDAYNNAREHILSGKTFEHLRGIQNG